MKPFTAALAVMQVMGEDGGVNREETLHVNQIIGAALDTIGGDIVHPTPANLVPPYPSPVKRNGNVASVEIIQVANNLSADAGGKQKKSKGGPTIPFERSPLDCSCPETFQLFGDRCERIIETPQETLCPKGSEFIDNACVRTVRPEEHCPYGFATINNHCVRRDSSIPKMSCAAGYTLETSAGVSDQDPALVCVKQFAVDNTLECPDGSRYNGHCFVYEKVPAEFTCPSGYDDLANNTCRRVTTVPCNNEQLDHKGIKNIALASVAGMKGLRSLVNPGAPRRQLSEEEGLVMTRIPVPHDSPLKSVALPNALRGKSETSGYHKWHQSPSHEQPNSFEIIDIEQTCVANITIPATPFCPVGELHGRLCRVPVPTNPIEVCPAYGNPSNCFAFDRLSPFATCQEGYTQECAVLKQRADSYVDCECVRVQERAIDLFCPAGYALDHGICVLRSEPYTGCSGTGRPVGNSCQRTESTPAVCSYTVSYACEGPACSTTTQHPAQKVHERPMLGLSIKKY